MGFSVAQYYTATAHILCCRRNTGVFTEMADELASRLDARDSAIATGASCTDMFSCFDSNFYDALFFEDCFQW